MAKLMKSKTHKVAAKKVAAEAKKVVLVGTYKAGQLEKWPGFYNYPICDGDKIEPEFAKRVNEIWLFNAKKEPVCLTAKFVGFKTREELKSEFGYPAKGKPHGTGNYILYATSKTRVYSPASGLAERVIVRLQDFATSKSVQKKLRDYLSSPDRKDPLLANYLPPLLSKIPPEVLRVCEAAVQLDFFSVMGDCVSASVPFPPLENLKFTFVDLFAGIGGFHLAMHELGGKCVFASEWDKDAQITYAANYGIVPKGDITKIKETDIPRHDVLCAGFPCQAFSKAGKQLGFADETKGTLFFDVERIWAYHRIKYTELENVRDLAA